MNKNLIKWGLIGLLGIGLIIVLVFLLRKSSQTNSVKINLTLQGPYPKPQTATMNLDKGILPSLTVGQFIGSVIDTTKVLPWSINDTYWLSMSIAEKSVAVSNGQFTDSAAQQNFYNLLGITQPPTSINVTASYKNSCSPNNYPTNLNVCMGQTGICTSTGWSILNYQYCPVGDDLASCCTDPDNPYASCSNNKVTCGPCPGSYDCGDPGCGLIGPKCTATGWVCAPGYACPTGNSLAACCTGINHPTCTIVGGRASLICSGCKGTPPVCQPDCNMCGLVCEDDGTWSCRQGAACPPENIMNTCCTNSNNPHSFCSPTITNGPPCTGPSGNVGVKCDNCDGSPKPIDPRCIQGSCQGHGYVCTSTGWICAPGVVCPDPNKFSWQQCCPTGYDRSTPYCDTSSNCIKCSCPNGFTGCPGQLDCGAPNSQCGQTCCPNGTPCSQGPDGTCICCAPERLCPTPQGGQVCCQPGTICQNGQCLIPCGNDPVSGQGVLCDQTEQCIEIDNLSSENIAKLKQEYGNQVRINGSSAFMCINPPSCSFTANESSLPASVHNYYPCLPLPDTDPNYQGVGYCTEANLTPTGQCFSKYKTQSDCGGDSTCVWRDVLKYATANSDPGVSLNQIQKEIAVIQGSTPNGYLGYFCDTSGGTTAYSRVVAYTSPVGSCNWDDCWARISQPGVIDIEYNAENGVCAALQSCNNPAGGLQSYQFSQNNGSISKNSNQVPPSTAQGDSAFGQCSTIDCPAEIQQFSDHVCVGSCTHCVGPAQATMDGQVLKSLWSCGSGNGYTCALDGGQSGLPSFDSASDCETQCCPSGMLRKDGKCYIYNPPIATNGAYCANGCPKGQGGNCTSSVNIPAVDTAHGLRCCNGSTCPFGKDSHATCDESIANIPMGTYYCVNSGPADNDCGSRYKTGQWTLCSNPTGCYEYNTWYWYNGGEGGNFQQPPSYCPQP